MLLMIKLGDKTYTSDRFSAGLVREALKIQSDSIKIAKKYANFQSYAADQTSEDALAEQIDNAEAVLEELMSLKDRKSVLVCKAYGNKFDIDLMEEYLTSEEIDREINKIIHGVSGVVKKT